MTVRNARQILNALAALCAVGIGCVVLWALTTPSLPEPRPPRLRRPTQASAAAAGSNVTDQQLESVWNRPLQGALVDKVVPQQRPQPKVIATPRPVNPRVELLATVIDPAKTLAIIIDARGRTDIKGVGETLDLIPSGLRIEDIQAGTVTLSLRGRSTTISLKGGTGSSPVASAAGRSLNGRNGGNRRPANALRRGMGRTPPDRDDEELGPGPLEPPPGSQGQPPRGMMQ